MALNRFSKEDLVGLLQHADPQGKEAKGTKTELLQRANQLTVVVDALAAYQANHVTQQPAPPMQPPEPAVPPPGAP